MIARPLCSRALLLPLCLAAGLGVGCGGVEGTRRVPFAVGRIAATRAEATTLAAEVARSPEAPVEAVAVWVAAAPAQGFSVVSLPSGRRLGASTATLEGRPHLAGDRVLARSGGSIVAWALDGTEAWRVPDGGFDLAGVSRDGGRIAMTLGGGGVTRRRGALVVLEAADGRELLRRRVDHALGAPAMVGSQVFVPWDGQNLSAFAVDGGEEIARLRSRDDVFAFARRDGEALYFGARSLYRLSAEAASGRRDGGGAWRLERDDLPGDAPFALDSYTALRAQLDARERVRLVWRPDPQRQGVALLHGQVYSLYHRELFALDAQSGAVRWAAVLPSDVVAAEVVDAGVVLLDESGTATLVDPQTGRARWRLQTGVTGTQAALQLPRAFSAAGGVEEAAVSVVEGLRQAAAAGNDARMAPAQRFAVRALAAIEDAEATGALVSLLTTATLPPEVYDVVAEAVAARTRGAPSMLDALRARYDFVRGTAAPPVGVLARGLASAGERSAVPQLLAHLHDPATPTRELPHLTAALRRLGDAGAVPGLLAFVRRYHADVGAVPPVGGGDPVDDRELGDQQLLDAALEQAASGVVELGGPAGRAALETLAGYANASPVVVRIAHAPSAAAPSTASAPEGASDMTFTAPPPRLSLEAIAEAFAPHRDAMLECLRGAPTRPAQVRIQFRYDHEGRITQPLVLPAFLQTCIGGIATHVTLPPSGAARELGTYYLRVL